MGDMAMGSMTNLTGSTLKSADGKFTYTIADRSMARKAYPWCVTSTTTSYFLKPTVTKGATTSSYTEYEFLMDENYPLCKEVLTKKSKNAADIAKKCNTPFYSFMIAISDVCHTAIMSVNTIQMFSQEDKVRGWLGRCGIEGVCPRPAHIRAPSLLPTRHPPAPHPHTQAGANSTEMYCHAHKGHDTGVPLLKYLIKVCVGGFWGTGGEKGRGRGGQGRGRDGPGRGVVDTAQTKPSQGKPAERGRAVSSFQDQASQGGVKWH